MAWYTNEGFDKIASSKTIKCPKCGTMNSASAHKCKNCGYVFHSEKKASENLEKKVLKAFKDEGGALGMKALKKHVPESGATATLRALMKRGIIVQHPHGDYYTPQVKKAAATATKTNPELWERSKAEAKAKMGGKHSARAMQLATQIYKKKGGGYSGAKPTAKNNSLKKWGKQKWQWSKEKKAAEGKGVYLPAAKIKRLKSSKEGLRKLRAAESKKTRATKAGEQYSSHGLAAGTSLNKKASVEYRGRTFPGYNKPVPSDKKNKKKMVLVKRGDKIKLVHFGQKGYEDFTQHKDKKRRKNYLTRSAGIRNKDGKLTKNDPFSPNYWARKELW